MIFLILTFNNNLFSKERQIDKLKSILDSDTAMYVIFVPSDGLVTCNNGKLKLYKDIAQKYNKKLKSIAVFVGFEEDENELIESIKKHFSDDYFISDYDQTIMNYFGIGIIPSIINVSNKSKNYKVNQEDLGIDFILNNADNKKYEIDFIDEKFKLTGIGDFIKKNDKYFIIDCNINTVLELDRTNKTINEKIKYNEKYYKSIENKNNWKEYNDTNMNSTLKFYVENQVHIETFNNLINIENQVFTETKIVSGIQSFVYKDTSKSYTLEYINALVNLENEEVISLDLDPKYEYYKKYNVGNYWISEMQSSNYKRDSLMLFSNVEGSLKLYKKLAVDDSLKTLSYNQYFYSNQTNYCLSFYDKKLFELDNNFNVKKDMSNIFTDLNNNFTADNFKPRYINFIEKNGDLFVLVELRSKERSFASYQLFKINLENKTQTLVFNKVYELDYNIEDIKLMDITNEDKFEFLVKLKDARWALYRKWN